MTSRKLVAATAGAVAALTFATSTAAQTPAPAAQNLTHGPAIPGLCVFSRGEALATSTVGKYIGTRIDQLVKQVDAELEPEVKAVQTESQTLQSSKATMDKATYDQRYQAMMTRAANLERKGQLRQRELQVTGQKAEGRFFQEVQPLLTTAYQQRKCSILLDGDGVMGVNPAMNITPTVVSALNAKIQQFSIERERLDQQQAAAAK